MLYVVDRRYYLSFCLLSLLVVTSDISEDLRIILNILVLIALTVLFIRQYGLNFSKYKLPPKEITYFVLLVLFSMTVSTLFSDYIYEGIGEIVRQFIFFILIYLFYSLTNTEKELFSLIYALVAAGTIVSVSIIFTFLTSDISLHTLQTQGVIHESGYFKNVTAAGGIIAISLILSVVLSLLNSLRRIRYFIFIFMAIQASALFLTNSRSAILASMISIPFILFKLKKIKLSFIYKVMAVLFPLLLYFYDEILELTEIYFRIGRVFENTRYHIWNICLSVIKNFPVFGVGPNAFRNYMYTYLPVGYGSWSEEMIAFVYENSGLGQQHNFLLFRTTELGILGFISAILLPVLFLKYSFTSLKKVSLKSEIYILMIGIIAIGIGLFARSFYEATGLLSHGWISRDLPFWILFIISIKVFQYFNPDNEIQKEKITKS